ncbi:MAG: amidase family protein [Candidatus Nanopelagicales bacterium]
MAPTDPHPGTSGVASLGVSALRAALAGGDLTSRSLVASLIDRTAAIDAPGTAIELRAVLGLSASASDEAERRDRERAEARRQGADLGPLHGIPVLVKDNIEAVGLPGTAGSLALAGRPVATDAPLVARLREAGAVIVGATNLSEWANIRSPRSTSGWSAVGGLTGNPWALDHSAGGSSSGSGAAVAAGLAPLAVGTETNGSITCPAALNGVVGIKPTVGSVSTTGVVPVSLTQDVPGPLARSVADAALLLEVLSGRTGLHAAASPGTAAGLRVGVAEGWLTGDPATDGVFALALSALEHWVATVSTASVPTTPADVHDDQLTALLAELCDDLGGYLAGRPGDGARSVADVVAFNEAHHRQELACFGQEFLIRSAGSGGRATDEYRQARARNVDWARDSCLGPALAGGPFDVLVAPAYRPAWKSDLTSGDSLMGGGAVCTPAAILGWPTATVPMGLVDGLPVGFSIVGPAGSEARLIAVAHALESSLAIGRPAPAWRPARRG